MPQGRYRVIGDDGESVDVAVDARWRIARFRVETAEHRLLLEPRNGVLAGVHDDEHLEVSWGPDDHLDYLTPATNLITCRRLGASADIGVVYVDAFSLKASRERQRYELLG